MDAEELSKLRETTAELGRLAEIEPTVEPMTDPTDAFANLPDSITGKRLGELSLGDIAAAEGVDASNLPRDIRDKPIGELSLHDLTTAVQEGGIGERANTLVICGATGCILGP